MVTRLQTTVQCLNWKTGTIQPTHRTFYGKPCPVLATPCPPSHHPFINSWQLLTCSSTLQSRHLGECHINGIINHVVHSDRLFHSTQCSRNVPRLLKVSRRQPFYCWVILRESQLLELLVWATRSGLGCCSFLEEFTCSLGDISHFSGKIWSKILPSQSCVT